MEGYAQGGLHASLVQSSRGHVGEYRLVYLHIYNSSNLI
jgi:hypothetical protein